MAAKAVALACTEIIRIMAAHKAGSSPRARRIIDIGFTDAAWPVQLTYLSRENRATLRMTHMETPVALDGGAITASRRWLPSVQSRCAAPR